MSRAPQLRFFRRKADLESLWLITFADLMVQLMAFFALLYSFSVADHTKLNQALSSIKKALGGPGQIAVSPGGEGILPGSVGIDPTKSEDLEKLLNATVATDGRDVGSHLRFVTFRGGLIFEEGSAVLTPGSDVILTRLSALALRYKGFTLVCEGHAAPGERGRNGADALELSALRALSAQRYLAGVGIPVEHLTSEARGDSQAEGDGSSPEGRALQRQVVFRFQRVAER